MRRFAPGTVASIALCKSAPMVCVTDRTNIVLSNGQSIVRVRLLACPLILCLLNQLTFHLDFSNSNRGGSVAEWLACWTQAQKDLCSNRSREAVG